MKIDHTLKLIDVGERRKYVASLVSVNGATLYRALVQR